MQQALLVRCLAYPDQPLYMGQWWAVLDGALDEPAFEAAWQAVVNRHTALRSGFHWDLKDHPFQVVHRQAVLKINRQDWSAEPNWHARLDAFLAEDRGLAFDLKKPPLLRVAVLRLAAARHIVVWTRHHLTVDGWSLGIILDEVFTLYKGLRQGRAAALPCAPAFRAYVDWEKSSSHSGALEHWRALLAATPMEDAAASGTPPAHASGPDIQHIERRVPAAAAQQLDALARSCRVTVNTLIQGAWAIVASRLDGRDTQLFGAVETVRPPQLDQNGDSRLVGIQIRIQPVLAHIGDMPLDAWLEALQANVAAARDAGAISMDELRELLGLPRDGLPFDSLVGFQNYPLDIGAALDGSGLAMAESGDITLPDMPLNLMVERQAGELSLQLMFDRRLRSPAEAALRLDMLAGTLAALPAQAHTAVAAIDALPAPLRSSLLQAAGSTTPACAAPHSVIAAILGHAARQPQAGAVVYGAQRLSYAGLAAIATTVADRLAQRGIGRGARVGLLLERTPLAIATIVGIMQSGASYVPLDLDAPDERKSYIVEQAGLAAVLADQPGELAGAPAIAVGDLAEAGDAFSAAMPQTPLPAHGDEAYVIFTSGSTGRPKGVSVNHGNLAYHVAARDAAYPGHPNRVLLLSFPLIFDGSITGIFGTLSIGGTLVLPKPIEATDPDRLAALIRDHGVTQTIMIPSQWGLMLSAGAPADFASMKMAVVAGEACPRDLVERHCARLPATVLSNEYGPTETTVWATVEICAAGDTGPVAIGRPIPGTRAYVVDGRNRLCPPGAAGELLIAGPGVAQGYVGRPDLTAERFIANPFHGDAGYGVAYRTGDRVVQDFSGKLRFHGRFDDQVKISGYRIELAEIAACLQQLPGVREAVAVAHRATPQAPARIVAHVAGPDLPSEEAILRHAQRLLPAYMVPHGVMLHERLPRTAAGKIDRHGLPEPRLREAAAEVPESGAEQSIAQIWQAVLGCGAVGRHDDFFAIGGRSLDAMQVVSRLRRDLKLGVDLIDLFEAPRLSDFARRVSGSQAEQAPAIRKRQRVRVELPSAAQPPEQAP